MCERKEKETQKLTTSKINPRKQAWQVPFFNPKKAIPLPGGYYLSVVLGAGRSPTLREPLSGLAQVFLFVKVLLFFKLW